MRPTYFFRSVLALFVAAVLAACGGGNEDDNKGRPLSFTLLDEYAFSGVAAARNRVARDQTAYNQIWQDNRGNRTNAAAPTVTFSTHAAVGMWLGSRPTGCAVVRIDSVLQLADRVQVRYFERQPAPNESCTAVVTTSGAIVSVPHQGLPVEAVQVQCTNNCSR